MNINLFKSSFYFMLILLAKTGNAQTTGNASGSMDVRTNVVPICNIDTSNISDIKLAYDPSQRTVNSSVFLKYTCTKGTAFNIKLDGGQNYDGTYRNLKNINGIEKIKYYLSAYAPNTTVFSGSGTGNSSSTAIPFYILQKQNVPAGQFRDVIIITFEY